MIHVWSFVSAFLLSFWMSRLVARLPLPMRRGTGRTITVHVIAGLLLFLAVGLIKAYFTPFAAGVAAIVLGTQAIWLVLDLVLTGSRGLGAEPRA